MDDREELDDLLDAQRRDLEARDETEPGSDEEREIAARLLERQERISSLSTTLASGAGHSGVRRVMDSEPTD